MSLDLDKEIIDAEFKAVVQAENARRCEQRGDMLGYTACLSAEAKWSAYAAELKLLKLEKGKILCKSNEKQASTTKNDTENPGSQK